MEFDWRDEKSDACLRDRGFDFNYASQVFQGPITEFIDNRKVYTNPMGDVEERITAIGEIGGRTYAVAYTMIGSVHWIISAIKCSPKEIERWKRHVAAGRSVLVGSTSKKLTPPRKPIPDAT